MRREEPEAVRQFMNVLRIEDEVDDLEEELRNKHIRTFVRGDFVFRQTVLCS